MLALPHIGLHGGEKMQMQEEEKKKSYWNRYFHHWHGIRLTSELC